MYYLSVTFHASVLEADVPCPPTEPPWEFLLSASRNSLQSYELSRLNHAANLRKEIGALLDQWMEENACAMLARWLIRQRELAPRAAEQTTGEELLASSGPRVSDNVFTNRAAPSDAIRGAA